MYHRDVHELHIRQGVDTSLTCLPDSRAPAWAPGAVCKAGGPGHPEQLLRLRRELL